MKQSGKTSSNRHYAAVAAVIRNSFYAVAENPSVWTGRLFLEQEIPGCFPHGCIPIFSSSGSGSGIGGDGDECVQEESRLLLMDSNLPSFQFIFPTLWGPPKFNREENHTYICK